jgi:hypothetical protein
MSEPILERLSRFTPDAGRLDRDALLFAAGRDSARPNRGWMTLASLLAGTQALSLALLWPHSSPSAAKPTVSIASVPAPYTAPEPPASLLSADPGLWSARRGLLESDSHDRPAGEMTFIDSEPPLRAFRPPPSLLN